MLAWAAIVVVLFGRFIRANLSFSLKVRGAREIDPAALPVDWSALCRQAGYRRPVPIAEIEELSAPAAWGLLRPRILMPSGLVKQMQPQPLTWVLLHELMHIRRGDLWLNHFERLVQIAYFFHPAALGGDASDQRAPRVRLRRRGAGSLPRHPARGLRRRAHLGCETSSGASNPRRDRAGPGPIRNVRLSQAAPPADSGYPASVVQSALQGRRRLPGRVGNPDFALRSSPEPDRRPTREAGNIDPNEGFRTSSTALQGRDCKGSRNLRHRAPRK